MVALPLGAGRRGGWAGWRGSSCPRSCAGRFGIDEVVTTLLLNPVAVLLLQGLLNGPWRNPVSRFPESEWFGDGYVLPKLFGTRVHAGLRPGDRAGRGHRLVLLATPPGCGCARPGSPHAGGAVLRCAGRRTLLS